VAEWLRSGLQSRLRGFDSPRRLYTFHKKGPEKVPRLVPYMPVRCARRGEVLVFSLRNEGSPWSLSYKPHHLTSQRGNAPRSKRTARQTGRTLSTLGVRLVSAAAPLRVSRRRRALSRRTRAARRTPRGRARPGWAPSSDEDVAGRGRLVELRGSPADTSRGVHLCPFAQRSGWGGGPS
jgi:hypothetical protein